MRLGYHTNTWGPIVGHPGGVTSIKLGHYVTRASMDEAIGDIAAAGYEGVELFDGNAVELGDALPEVLARHGVALVAVYCGGNFIYRDALDDELWRIERVAELAAAAGAEHLVIGGGARRPVAGADDHERLAEALDRVADLAGRHGLTPSYHPHMGTLVETPEDIRRVFSLSRIGFCPDTAHLIRGGGDPAALIAEYAGRIPYVHLKDVTPDGTFVALGRGVLDLPAALAALRAQAYDGWLVVELDSAADPAGAAAESYARLAAST
jgi:inosose dehydratase